MEANTLRILKRWGFGLAILIVVLALIWQLQRLSTLMLLSFMMAYVLNPLVTRLSKVRLIGRTIATLITMSLLLLVLMGVIFVIAPIVVSEFHLFFKHLPTLVEALNASAIPWVESRFAIDIPDSWHEVFQQIYAQFKEEGDKTFEPAARIANFVFNATSSAIFLLVGTLMFPLFLFFLLKDFPVIIAAVDRLIPRKHREVAHQLAGDVDKSLSAFLHGQFMVMLVLGTLYAIGYSIVEIPMAIGLGLLTGLLCFIPYVGAATGFLLALCLAALKVAGWTPVFGVMIVFGTVQALDAAFITPRILGGKLGLKPLWIIVALMAGGELFGFLGVLLAVPTTAVAKVLVHFSIDKYRQSSLYTDGAPLSIAPPAQSPAAESDDTD